MGQLRRIVKFLVPPRVRRSVLAAHRDLVFRRGMRRFLRDPLVLTRPGDRVTADLIFGWGNEAWSALDDYLVGCVEHALTIDGPILECGSGLSTILIGAVARSRGLKHWALEHEPDWGRKVRGYLDKYRIDSVELCVGPMKDYGEYSWYNPPIETMPESFALVICDGPPGVTKGGRYGLGPIMKNRLRPGSVILLDDAGREHEQAIAKRWESELGATGEATGEAKPYIKLTVRAD